MKLDAINTCHILPGYSIQLSNKKRFNKKQYHEIKNGFDIRKSDLIIDGSHALEDIPHVEYNPVLMYRTLKKPTYEKFIPKFVKYDGRTLIFRGYIVPQHDENTTKRYNGVSIEAYQNDLMNDSVQDSAQNEESCKNTREISENETLVEDINVGDKDVEETIPNEENDIREIFLVYYLEDDTVKITEKRPDSMHYSKFFVTL